MMKYVCMCEKKIRSGSRMTAHRGMHMKCHPLPEGWCYRHDVGGGVVGLDASARVGFYPPGETAFAPVSYGELPPDIQAAFDGTSAPHEVSTYHLILSR